MKLDVEVQNVSGSPDVPDAGAIQRWVAAALADWRSEATLCVRVVDAEEARALNHTWRGRDYATNVLSFPCADPPPACPALLGDIVICASVVRDQAQERSVPAEQHWAHLVVHGTLHLLGYDHQETAAADAMEALEIGILDKLGYPDPYGT
ncbi:MAG: rRNA maturation RNase YbeY [Gammaproteobacteria bacterium]|nr:rRNA maturation RNase YbeY [Gammaproteobacteria bacterium]